MDLLHRSVEAILALGLVGVGKLIWNLSATLATLNANMTVLMNNHLPHLEGEIKQLKDAFLEHLLKGDK